MTSAGGWEPEPLFGDALSGSAGMSEPVQPNLFSAGGSSEVFPDALSGVLVGGARDVAVTPPVVALPAPGPLPWGAPARPQPARPQRTGSRTPPPRPWSQPMPPGATAPPRSWSQMPPPGRQFPPPGQPVASPIVAPLSRNPTVGYGPVPGAPPVNASLIRPPAYLPQGVGIAQIRAAMQQVRRTTADKSRATASATKSRGVGVWGVLLALVIVLVVTGLAEKIITAISHLLQGT